MDGPSKTEPARRYVSTLRNEDTTNVLKLLYLTSKTQSFKGNRPTRPLPSRAQRQVAPPRPRCRQKSQWGALGIRLCPCSCRQPDALADAPRRLAGQRQPDAQRGQDDHARVQQRQEPGRERDDAAPGVRPNPESRRMLVTAHSVLLADALGPRLVLGQPVHRLRSRREAPVIIAPVSLNPASTARSNPARTARPSYRGTLLTSVADTMVRCGTKYSTWIGQQVTRVRVCSRPVGRSTATSV